MVSQAFIDAVLAPSTIVTRRVDIYEQDGTTPYYLNVPTISGSVTVDSTRDERRGFDLTLSQNDDPRLKHYTGGLWYDKVIKMFRGCITSTASYETQIGEFVIDNIAEPNFPKQISLTGRDYSKKLLASKFAVATAFASGQPIETVIHTIAVNGGISKFILPVTGKTLGGDVYFDRGTERLKAIKQIADSYGYDVYFDAQGYMVMEEYADPVTSATVFTFKTGPQGSLNSYEKRSSDTRLYNHIAVTGENSTGIPVTAEAINNSPTSPTSVGEIGDRLYEFVSSFIYTTQQAQDVADKFLKIHALEQYELNLTSLVLPWLDAGKIIEFIDPDPAPGDPTRFLLSSFSIPLGLETMSSLAKRVTIVS